MDAGHYAEAAGQSTIRQIRTHTDLVAEYKAALNELQDIYEDVQTKIRLCFKGFNKRL